MWLACNPFNENPRAGVAPDRGASGTCEIPCACAHYPHLQDEPFADPTMATFILWLLLLVFYWPLAVLALVLYPIVWLLLLPFRLVGIAVGGVFELLAALLMLPARMLRRLA
jgi:hypothetical protein